MHIWEEKFKASIQCSILIHKNIGEGQLASNHGQVTSSWGTWGTKQKRSNILYMHYSKEPEGERLEIQCVFRLTVLYSIFTSLQKPMVYLSLTKAAAVWNRG